MKTTRHPPQQTSRRAFLGALGGAGLAACLSAAEGAASGLLPGLEERLRALAEGAPLSLQFTGSTAAEARAWQQEFGRKLATLLGPFHPPPRWESVLERTVEEDDHLREERLLTAPGVDPVPVYFLLPRDSAIRSVRQRPAVLAIHGHGITGYDGVIGRDETAEQREEVARYNYDFARQFVRRGYVVAAPCLTPFGRRSDGPQNRSDACVTTYVRLQFFGRLLMADNLRDILWTLEETARRPEVDAGRLGCAGLSYGGRMTMLAAAVEPRIKAAVISGALNCMQERVSQRYSGACQIIPGLLQYGDVPEISGLTAPRPILFEIGSRDRLIDPDWAERALGRIRRIYAALGAEHAVHVDRFEGGHQWHGPAAYRLFEQVLVPPGT